uniref:Metallo-beta-lactamase domain-containing protein 1 n=1 Tax=Strongyloides stercoralis TaxID=6248 RepID=A0AAF5D0L2_STRER
MSVITQLIEGYVSGDEATSTTKASGSVTLIESNNRILLFDCGDPWNEEELKESLFKKKCLKVNNITDVIISHWHIDHIGNLNAFENGKLRTSLEEFNEIEKLMNITIGMVKECHSNEDVYIIAFDGKDYTLVAGDLFENEDDIWNEKYWYSQSKNIYHQKLQRYLLSIKVNFIIPGHGPLFKLTERHKQKLYDDAFKGSDLIKIHTVIDNKYKCYIEGIDYCIIINDWNFNSDEEYKKITHFVVTHNIYDYFVNIKKFSNAKIIMDNDIAIKNSYFPNELVGAYNGKQLTVVAISSDGNFYTIVD